MANVSLNALPWFYRSLPSRVLLVSIASGIAVFFACFGLEYWLFRNGSPATQMIFASDLLAGLLTAAVQFVTIHLMQQKRALILQRLYVIAEMNHHIRNALETMQSAAILGGLDRDHTNVMEESARRITWALDEILGRE